MKPTLQRWFVLVASTLVASVLNLLAQSAPTITAQPLSQTVPPATKVSFSVGVDGSAPFSYQWQLNGSNLPNNLIRTVAGVGGGFLSGDGHRAVNAGVWAPQAVALDAAGNLYIADANNNRIRKVNALGVITTIAGTNASGYSGDGGAATNASLYRPCGVALDAAGNLYIADLLNERIRKVDTNGIISTVAGNGSNAYSGDGGAATDAGLSAWDLASDAAGNLYIADADNHRIRKVDPNGIITTLAGNGIAQFAGDGGMADQASLNQPLGVAVDASGDVYIADAGNYRVRKVDPQGFITTVAGNGTVIYPGDGGAATNAGFSALRGLTLDGSSNLFIVDACSNCVRKVDAQGYITTVAGNGTAAYAGDGGAPTNASLSSPKGVAVDLAGNLYIADTTNNRVRKVWLYAGYPILPLPAVEMRDAGNYSVVVTNAYGSVTSAVATLALEASGIITTQPVSRRAAAGTSPSFSVAVTGLGPFGYCWFFNGTNLIQSGSNPTLTLPQVHTDASGSYTVVITNAYGSVTSRVAQLTVGLPPVLVSQPAGQSVWAGTNVSFTVAASGLGPFRYQWLFNGTNQPNNLITTVAGNGNATYSGDGGPATNASLYYPQGVGFDAAGDLYIADNNNDRVRKVDSAGIITTVAGDGYGATTNGGRYAGDGGPAINASLYRPNNLAWDAAGNMYIADIFNQRIRRVDTLGIMTTVVGDGSTYRGVDNAGDGGAASIASLNYPASVAFDAGDNFYIADLYNNGIRRVDSNGIITTVAGRYQSGRSGDGGAATNAYLYLPQGACLDSLGNLFIADTGNGEVRTVDTNGIITRVAGGGSKGDGSPATNAVLFQPWYVALDSLGQLYIAEYGNNRVRMVNSQGIITTVAGNGHAAYSGDGGASTNASLNGPACVTLDGAGNLFIADWHNNRIREVHLGGFPAFSLTDVKVANAGDYSVIVSSPYGSVTSTVATLTVNVPRTPPQLVTTNSAFGFKYYGQFGFDVSGAPGQTIIVEGSVDLLNWTPLYTNTIDLSPFYFHDPLSTTLRSRYYRARLP